MSQSFFHCNRDKRDGKMDLPDGKFNEGEHFSVILCKNERIKQGIDSYSTAYSAKPLTYFASFFGLQMIRYSNGNILKVNFLRKLYCLVIVATIISLIVFVKPFSWRYTKADVPLNMLTKSYSVYHTIEVIYTIFITSIGNSIYYLQLFKILDSTDKHFGLSKGMFKIRVASSVLLILLPIIQTSYTFWLRKFNINNIGAHFTFFMIMIQGAVIIFFSINIYLKQMMLNRLLILKTFNTIPSQKRKLFEESLLNIILKNLLREPTYIERNHRLYSWFELMQIYDKVSDSIFMFNKIYSGQVFIMFSSWLLCTLLTLCRSLSPTVKFMEVIFSDLFMYLSLNGRPIYLTIICEMFIEERKKTLALLLNHLIRGDMDDEYGEQVERMIDLVQVKKLKITGNVFTVDAVTVMNFSGKVVSYAVLMIQYFYLYIFTK